MRVDAKIINNNSKNVPRPQFYIRLLNDRTPYSFVEFESPQNRQRPREIPVTLYIEGERYDSANVKCDQYDKPPNYIYLSSPRSRKNPTDQSLTNALLDAGLKADMMVSLEVNRSQTPNVISLHSMGAQLTTHLESQQADQGQEIKEKEQPLIRRPDAKLGAQGEKFVKEHETEVLRQAERQDLAGKVQVVAEEKRGYDVLSYNGGSGDEVWIEVKTTRGPLDSPFYLTSNEKKCAEMNLERYRLYRVYCFDDETAAGQIKILSAREVLELEMEPLAYRVRFPVSWTGRR